MARDPYIDQRMKNWARWKRGHKSGGLGFASVNWAAFQAEDRYATSAAVLPDGEEAITDKAVESLQVDQQDALCEQYLETGDIAAKARRLGCHERTFQSRVEQGLRMVGRWLAERERQLEEERERVECLQRAAAGEDAPESKTRVRVSLGGEWLAKIRARREGGEF